MQPMLFPVKTPNKRKIRRFDGLLCISRTYHDPLKMNIDEAKRETQEAWARSYSSDRNRQAIESIQDSPIDVRISHLVARLFFRGIYFPQMGRWAWIKLLLANRVVIFNLSIEGFSLWRDHRKLSRIKPERFPPDNKDQQILDPI